MQIGGETYSHEHSTQWPIPISINVGVDPLQFTADIVNLYSVDFSMVTFIGGKIL